MGTTVTKQGEWGNIVDFETLVVGDAFYALGYPETVYLKTTDAHEASNAMYHKFASVDDWASTHLQPHEKVVGLDSRLTVKGPPA